MAGLSESGSCNNKGKQTVFMPEEETATTVVPVRAWAIMLCTDNFDRQPPEKRLSKERKNGMRRDSTWWSITLTAETSCAAGVAAWGEEST